MNRLTKPQPKFIFSTIVVFLTSLVFQVVAQDQTAIPLNPDIRYGKLKNGLTYYVLKNSEPKDKVELRLAVNVGSMQENEDQLGLAHFTEHMGFNGTKNFEKNELVDYLQSKGVKFGAHLNAYTSFDETVYMLTLPTDDQEVVTTGFQVLGDWANGMLFTEEEVDKERGVVLEEYRIGQGAGQRMRERYFPKLLYESRYANRLPIGKKEVLENFSYKTIRQFYADWYRPNMMAVIVVGDIDPDVMEAKIKSQFGKTKNPKKPRKRESYPVPNHNETFIAVESDPEFSYSIVQLYFKDPKPVEVVNTVDGYKNMLINQLFSSMLNGRLDEIRNSVDPPFSYAGGGYSSMVRTKNAFIMQAYTPETGQLKALEVLLRETQRVKHHGFTENELNRVKQSQLAYMEKAYNERDKSQSRNYASEFIRNYLEKEPAPGIAWEYKKHQELLPSITIDDVNKLIDKFISKENRVVIFLGPQKEELEKVSEERIRKVLTQMDEVIPEPYAEEDIANTLMESMPDAGSIIKTETNEELGFKTVTLSNGMQVSYKVTDFKNDEILMRGYSYGGTSTWTDEEYLNTDLGMGALFSSGVGNFSAVDLKKFMAGKIVRISPSINTNDESLNGSTTPKDLESMFQMIHLYFTDPRKDNDAFESYISRNKSMYANLNSNPQAYFSIKHQKFLTQDDVRSFDIPTEEDWQRVDYDLMVDKYREAFANPGDFKLFFVGNIDEDQMLEYSKTYLASIPDNGRRDQMIDRGVRIPKGMHEKIYKKGVDPKSYVMISFEGDADFNRDDQYRLSVLGDILSIKLIEILREEKGGVYGIGASGSLRVTPYPHYEFSINFPCGPENAMDLKDAALAELNKILEEGPQEKDLNKVKEEKRKTTKERLRTNGYWIGKMYGDSYTQAESYTVDQLYQRIEDLTIENIQTVGKKYLNGDYVVGILMPEDM